MKLKTIYAVSNKYIEKGKILEARLAVNPEINSNFIHIVNNSLMPIIWAPEFIAKGRKWEEIRGSYVDGIRTLRRYFTLLEKFPNFAKIEVNNENGYFPELKKEVVTGSKYVEEAYKRLIK